MRNSNSHPGLRQLHSAAANSAISRALAGFRAEHHEQLAPCWSKAMWWFASRFGVAGVGHIIAARAADEGAWWAALPAFIVGAMATGSLLVMVHDLAHGTFFPSKPANRIVGHALAPLFLVDYGAFRRAHLQHHRAPQSPQDPNFTLLKLEQSDSRAVVGESQSRRRLEELFFAPLRLTQHWPMVWRAMLYLPTFFLIYPLALLSSPNELTLLHRDFRDRSRWLPLVAPFLIYGGLWQLWPALALSVLLGAWFTLVTTLMLVLPHALEAQQIFCTPVARNIAALNASDLRQSRFAQWFTGGISDYHAAHHLDCSVPIYALPILGQWVDKALASWKAPSLSARDLTLLPRFVDRILQFASLRSGGR